MNLKYCNHCQNKVNCLYYQENNFCRIETKVEEDLFGFDNAKRKELIMFLNIQNQEEVNVNCKFFKKVREELKDLILFFEELKEEEEEEELKEDAGF